MEESSEKYNTVIINTYINELMSQTEVIQYFKNVINTPVELQIMIPQISDINITRFEMTKKDKKVVSKLLEKEKAKEKYNDTISSGDYGMVSYNRENETKICMGNISPGEEIELKTYFFGHIVFQDLSYQAKFPLIFPKFFLENPKNGEDLSTFEYSKKIVKGKIYLNTNSKITRLIIQGSKNFTKIEKKYGEDKKSAEIDIYKDSFSETDIPGIVLFRTEKIYDEKLYYQYDPKKDKSYYMLHKAMFIPELNKEIKDEIDEDENTDYYSLIKIPEKKEQSEICYIFLLDQSGSMEGERIGLCCKSLLLLLQSLNPKCYFQLIGFGSNYEYYNEKPLEYNKTNIKNLMKTIKTLKADKGGTQLYNPLNDIYNNKIYKEYNMKKNIILLTDGELDDKEKVINLIGSKSDEFIFNSLGIGECDKDLIKRTALVGRGYSNYIKDLNDLNSSIISLLEYNKEYFNINYTTNQQPSIEDNNKKLIEKYDIFNYGFILDEKNPKDIEFNIKIGTKEEVKINFDKNKIIKLPDGDKLGRLIVDNYLKSNKNKDTNTIIKLSKEYSILTNETAFYAKIANDVPVTEKMVKLTNENKQAVNNKVEPVQHPQNNIEEEKKDDNYEIYKDEHFGYDIGVEDDNDITEEKSNVKEEPKKGFFGGFFSKLFSKNKNDNKDNIIRKKNYQYEYKPKKKLFNFSNFGFMSKYSKKALTMRACRDRCDCCIDEARDNLDDLDLDGYEIEGYSIKEDIIDDDGYSFKKGAAKTKESKTEEKEEKEEPKVFSFDEMILGQDIIDGNWEKDSQIDLLIKQENDLFEKIKKLAENKGIKEENGIITLFVLYYIYNKKQEKVGELKFIINKAKEYVKKIFSLDYDEIIKDI